MPSNAQWLATAKKLYSTTFSGQTNNTVILKEVKADYATQTTTATKTDTITLARVYNAKLSKFESSSIQVGDRMVGIINENLTVNPRADNTTCTVNGVEVSIENVAIDEAGAVYTLQVRDK
jgi:hypothetical protein